MFFKDSKTINLNHQKVSYRVFFLNSNSTDSTCCGANSSPATIFKKYRGTGTRYDTGTAVLLESTVPPSDYWQTIFI